MRIAFTHNLQLSSAEEEAEFDTPETVAMIAAALRKLGHEVEPLEVSGPASRAVARLEALAPDLVFNTAEGTRGRFREAFYPALFDRLGFPFTGSDAYTCALTLDKQLTKMIVESRGVPVPRGIVAHDVRAVETVTWRFPVIVKPNYEGSSMGITVDSVVDHVETLRARVIELLARYPAGVLVEEFIVGRDLVVPLLAKASPKTGGVLEPASYHFDTSQLGERRYQLYDYELKSSASDAVSVKVPAEITDAQRSRAMELGRIVFDALEIRDAGRIDFRIGDDGQLYFIEINALPSLEKGASIYASAALAGLDSVEAVLDNIVKSAADRHGLSTKRGRSNTRKRHPLRVGLTFNLRSSTPPEGMTSDEEAEFDSPETIKALHDAIASYGHEVVELEATPELPSILPAQNLDVVFNIAEGIEGRARESQVPALLEMLRIPYTGSDTTALALSLDKALAKRVVAQSGVPTPPSMVMHTGKERLPPELTFPAICKPVAEGSSRGVFGASVVEDEAALRELAKEVAGRYKQAVLVESFLPGREFTVALLGEKRPRVLPPMEVVFVGDDEKHPVYSFARKFQGQAVKFDVPAKLDPALQRELERAAKISFTALGCRDVARIDFRLDARGRVNFIECNPLPGLSPGFSDICVTAEAAGMDYRTLVGEILAPALRRHRERRRERVLEGRL